MQLFKIILIALIVIGFYSCGASQEPIQEGIYKSALKLFNPFENEYRPQLRYPSQLAYIQRELPEGPVTSITTIKTKEEDLQVFKTYRDGKLLKDEAHFSGKISKKVYHYSPEGILDSHLLLNPNSKPQMTHFSYEDGLLTSSTINNQTTKYSNLNDSTEIKLNPDGTFDTVIFDQKGNMLYESINHMVDEDIVHRTSTRIFNKQNQTIKTRNKGYTKRLDGTIKYQTDIQIIYTYNKYGLMESYLYGKTNGDQIDAYYDLSYHYNFSKNADGNHVAEQISTDAKSKDQVKQEYEFDKYMNWISFKEFHNNYLSREEARTIVYEF